MKLTPVVTATLILATFLASTAFAAGEDPITITSEAVVEKKVATPEGRLEIKRFPADQVLPGTTVIYVNTIVNNTLDSAEDIAITNPIPEHMSYIAGSAAKANVTVTYSVDGGQRYDAPEKLTVPGPDGKPRPAEAADYTDIRWQLNQPLPGKSEEQVEFMAKVK